jgi:hypothetical protein
LERIYALHDAEDTTEKYLATDGKNDRIVTSWDADPLLKQLKAEREEDGFDITRSFRRVAHIDMRTVKLLALTQHDPDAQAYLDYHDADARDRMIRHYPMYFKACSGRV